MPYTCLAVIAAILFAVCCVLAAMIVSHRKKVKKEKEDTFLFLSTVAHDIRSPLTNVKGFADALLSGEIDGERKEQALATISLEASRLASLTERLCYRDESITVTESVFGICELFRAIFLSLERKTAAKGIDVSYSFGDDDEIYVRTDKALIHEALYNICDNAVKYCDGSKISVSVRICGKQAEISVANGAESSDFTDYFTAGSRGNTKEKGTGLGLYISQKLIKSCGSELRAEKSGDTVAFGFSLPVVGDEE